MKNKIKYIITYFFLGLACVTTLIVGYLVTRALMMDNNIEKTGLTNTFVRAKNAKIDISMTKSDFYTDTSHMAIINLEPEKFLIIYNKNQMKLFTRQEFGDFSDHILSQRLTSFASLLWKYIEMSKIMKLQPFIIEKNMGKLVANCQDYTHDMVTYTNFCLGFLAKQTQEQND